jgi:hypothetical protein
MPSGARLSASDRPLRVACHFGDQAKATAPSDALELSTTISKWPSLAATTRADAGTSVVTCDAGEGYPSAARVAKIERVACCHTSRSRFDVRRVLAWVDDVVTTSVTP